jgi:peptidyl-prolyl cis-trans isomerase C
MKKGIWLTAAALTMAASTFPALAAQEECVLATIGDEKITEAYIAAETAGKPGALKGRDDSRVARNQLLTEILDRKKFAQAARREGLDKDEQIRLRIQRQAEQILAEAYIEHVKARVALEEKESMEYYEQHKRSYELPEEFHLRHIMVKEEAEAGQILAELQKGADFAEVAAQRSVYRGGRKGGDLGWMDRGRMEALEPALRDAAYKLGPGEMSGVVESKKTYHILKMEGYRPIRYKPFEEVRTKIEAQLLSEKQAEAMRTAGEKLGEEFGVKVLGDCGKTRTGGGRSQ